MKLVIQRVKKSSVTVGGKCIGSIDQGLLVLVGVGASDTEAEVEKYVNKLVKLRIFQDENDKTNLSLLDVKGELLIISQFTLYADCHKGNRPSFIQAGSPDMAQHLYKEFLRQCRTKVDRVECGEFGADMTVSIENDGPFTIVLENL